MVLPGLSLGEELPRREVHVRYGGQQQGGISSAKRANAVLFFTDPAKGHRHGYYDGMGADGLFHYVGEGQRGDQELVRGNRAILNHLKAGTSLEGFRTRGTKATYLGEFELVDYYFTDAHETGNPDVMRQVVVFKLSPLNALPVGLLELPFSPVAKARVMVVPVEEQHTERAFVTPDREPYELERRESGLVARYRQYLLAMGHEVGRLCVLPPGETRPLYSDLWDETTGELIEAKSTVTRDHLRMAVGQLLDYGRFGQVRSRAVLVPSRPRPDLLAYLRSAQIDVIYPQGEEWFRVRSE